MILQMRSKRKISISKIQNLVKRFQGQIQGLGTDKDEEILAWLSIEKERKGETKYFHHW